ncbi:QWRF motif-containing protein 4-like isoform X1 [Capsicum annuum]|uniref:QWRF motif-containing protein 4-like isoform X1 n=1 Tax=Capsicum annuum TaxID=4072 RepID=UPI001FB13B43|nr:QWRF motif-containing protein 4-like isoform X1 [Capsicum annuum]
MIDGEHCNSLSGTICAMEASIIRLPVVEGAKAEVQNVKDAFSSAVDVMQALGSSMCSLQPKQTDKFVEQSICASLGNNFYSLNSKLFR